MIRNIEPRTGRICILLAATLLVGLTGCVDHSGSTVGVPPSYIGNSHRNGPGPHQIFGYGYGHAGQNDTSNYHHYPRYTTYYSPQPRHYY